MVVAAHRIRSRRLPDDTPISVRVTLTVAFGLAISALLVAMGFTLWMVYVG